jgi:hypothetical protein
MTWKYWPMVCLAVMVPGALAIITDQVTALANGQFAHAVELEEQRMAESRAADAKAGHRDGAGPGVGMAIATSFLCCFPCLVPPFLAGVAALVMLNPITGSRIARVIAHLSWAGWCACAVGVCVMYGAENDFWGPLQTESRCCPSISLGIPGLSLRRNKR